ncbi:10989_t:CDS:2, partial [Funneliformis caledonium]
LVDYLNERDPSTWSYIDFLTLNRTAIVNLLPHLDKQEGLDGAWTKRFLLAVKEISPESADDVEGKVILEHTKSNLCSFWQEVIIERLQRKIQSNYDMETLYTYDESSKFYGKQFRLPYTGQTIEATSSQHRSRNGEEISDNYELENDDNNRKRRSMEKDQEEKSKRRNVSQNIGHITTIDVTDVDEESDYSETEDSCEMLDFTEFDESYIAMDPEKMWELKSGRKVEEIIYQYARKLHKESCLHSFILNDTDKNAKTIFSKEEWKEIFSTDVQKKPEIEAPLLELIKKYTLDNVNDLRKSPYSHSGMLFLWEMEDSFTSDQSKLEGWYQLNVWSKMIDPAFYDVKFELVRGEGMSFASSDRKNDGKMASDRKKIGRKGDGIFRITTDRMELGAVEAGRKWEGLNGTKYLKDSLKLNKMLKDMITKLISECNHNIFRQLQVIGILNGGNRLQTIIMDAPRGYICRVKRGKIHEVNGRLTKIQPLGFVIKEILRAKAIIVKTLDLISNDKLNDLFNDTDDDDYDDIENNLEKPRSSTPPPTFPKTFSTPRTSKTENKLKK